MLVFLSGVNCTVSVPYMKKNIKALYKNPFNGFLYNALMFFSTFALITEVINNKTVQK